MAYYMVFHFSVTDPAAFATYPPAVMPTILQHGGKVLMAAGPSKLPGMAEVHNHEGTPQHPVTVLLEFPSAEACRRWYTSPEYQAVAGLRTGSTQGWVVGAEGFQLPG